MCNNAFAIDGRGVFTTRPSVNDVYLSPRKEQVIIAASWCKGVVLLGGKAISTEQFQNYIFYKKGERDYGC